MSQLTPLFDAQQCAVCRRDTSVGPSFMRLYLEKGRLEFCTPTCARVYQEKPRTDDGAGQAEEGGWARWRVRWGK